MTGDEYRKSVKTLGMSLNGAGRFFHVGVTTAHRWAIEGPPTSVSMMLTLMINLHVTPAWVNYWIGRGEDSKDR